jgi:chromosome segregation ATPase
MAIGVPEGDVFAAADAVLARGERPTVERVRQELGRGSPARVGGLLDKWWTSLAARIKGESRLPALPSDVAQAFSSVWQQAVQFAQVAAEAALAGQRQVLNEERLRVGQVEEQARQETAASTKLAANETKARMVVEARLADLALLLDQRQGQIDAVQGRCNDAIRERDLAREQAQELQVRLEELRLKTEHERIGQAEYVRAVENRAHREVDHLRQEIKASGSQLKMKDRELAQLQRRINTVQAELNAAQQTAVAQQARSETLEQQLTQARKDVPLKLKHRTRNPAKRRKSSI